MTLMDPEARELASAEMEALIDQLRAATRRLSRDQMLDLADLLHELIRERQVEERSWRRIHARTEAC